MPSTSTKYYNRPSFLASPPDYALPSWSDHGPSRDVSREHIGREGTQGASSGAAMLAIAHANTRKNIPRSFGSAGARMYAASQDQHARVPFPDPPTLADIQRMEPDLSPASMRRRASDVDDRPLPQELIDDAMGDEESDVSMSPPCYVSGDFYLDRPVIEESSPIIIGTVAQDQVAFGGPSVKCLGHPSVLEQDIAMEEDNQSFFDTPSPTVVSRDTVQDQKLQENVALTEWAVCYMYDYVMTGELPNDDSTNRIAVWRNFKAFGGAVERVWNILSAMSLPRSAVFLALWYATRLRASHRTPISQKDAARYRLRSALLDNGRAPIEDRVVRSLVVGLMMADKWLDDHTFILKTWHEVTDIPMATLRSMEVNALAVLNFNLTIKPSVWQSWLGHIEAWHVNLGDVCFTREHQRTTIDNILDDIFTSSRPSDDPAHPEPRFLLAPKHSIADQEQNNIWDMRTSAPECPDLPAPAEWVPEKDPVVYRAKPRTSGTAPGMYRANGLTAQDIANAMAAGVPATLPPPGLHGKVSRNASMMHPSYTYGGYGYPVTNVRCAPSWGAAPVY